jgi:hypothetical protein
MPEICCLCEEEVSLADVLYCNGGCKKLYHRSCMNLNKAAVKYINECVNIKWLCNECLHFSDCMSKMQEKLTQVIQMLENHEEKIENHGTVLDELLKKVDVSISVQNKNNNALNNSVSMQNNRKNNITFADVLKNKNEEPVVVIKPKNSEQKSDVTKKLLKEKIDPSKIHVNDLRNVSNGGVVIRCNNSANVVECKKMIEKELGNSYEVSVPEPKKPTLKIVGLTELFEKDDLIEKIKSQNDFISENAFIEVTDISRRKSIITAIIKTDGETFQKLIERERIYVGWDRCRLYEHFYFQQCFNCAGFHHLAKDCKNNVSCPRCAGSHPLKECSATVNQCSNCITVNRDLKLNIPTDHPAWSRECSVFLRKVSAQRQKIKYSK